MISILLIPSIIILLLGGGLILHVFGKSYAGSGVEFLRLVAIAGIVVSAYSIVNVLLLVKKNTGALLVASAIYAGTIIGLSYVLLPLGLTGIGIAWLVGNTIAAVVAYLLYHYEAYIARRLMSLRYERWVIIKYSVLFGYVLMKRGCKRTVILFYPETPRAWHIIYRIVRALGLSVSNDPRKPFDLAIAFADTTIRTNDPIFNDLCANHHVINARCNDISKKHVEEVFQKVFGYGTAVDPRTYHGVCVKKSDKNTMHDGAIIQCPVEPEQGYIYQRLINNAYGNDKVMDIRTLIMGNTTIPLVLYRHRSMHDRFDHTEGHIMIDPRKAFSADEYEKILAFCREFGLEYGELDVLRDNDDGKIYIVDANNTPSGPYPGVHTSHKEYALFLSALTRSFASAFLQDE